MIREQDTHSVGLKQSQVFQLPGPLVPPWTLYSHGFLLILAHYIQLAYTPQALVGWMDMHTGMKQLVLQQPTEFGASVR